jgi:hypothetical protein
VQRHDAPRVTTPIGFDDVEPRVGQWLQDEQTLNERVFLGTPTSRRSANKLRGKLRPELRASWEQDVVWLDQAAARVYGPLQERFADAFGEALPAGRVPLLLHPRPPASHRRLVAELGRQTLAGVSVTPTSSYRSLLAKARGRSPVVVKLSLGVILGSFRRAVDEHQVSIAVLMTRMLEAIPEDARRAFGLDWFPEPAGVVEAQRGEGWILRDLPRALTEPDGGRLIPAFSLIARSGEREPLLVDLIRQEGGRPERVVCEQILTPYVRALSYLLLVEGMYAEGHIQNVLFEWGPDGRPTGRVVLRDLGDMCVSIPLRLARRRPFPELDGELPPWTPFPLGSIVSNHEDLTSRTGMYRVNEAIVSYGLNQFVWAINESLARSFSRYDAERVRRRYLELWRDAMMRLLPVKVRVREAPLRIPTDEVFEHVLRRIDWTSLGAVGGASLPEHVEPVMIGGRARRSARAVYDRLDCEWGELYVREGLPVFFRPIR